MTSREWLAVAVIAAPTIAALLVIVAPRRTIPALGLAAACLSALAAIALAIVALVNADDAVAGDWLVVDVASGLIVGIVGIVGLASALTSPVYLRSSTTELVRAERGARLYYGALLAFWAVLVAVPLAGNLGVAWLLIEATTAASVLLVGFSGKATALEAGWKYLVLTSLGLGFALLGIVLIAPNVQGGLGGLSWGSLGSIDQGSDQLSTAFVLLLAGLAAKVGWAPVHNWLPDAHSEAPPPVSALLSAACSRPCSSSRGAPSVRSLPPSGRTPRARSSWPSASSPSRSPSRSSGELRRGSAFSRTRASSTWASSPSVSRSRRRSRWLASIVHVVGHAVAKALGFYAATPLLAHAPAAGTRAVSGIARTSPALGASLGISLGTLAGLPPSPLFASEVLIVAGGFSAGRPWEAGAAVVLLALGFLGLGHTLLDVLVGKARRRTDGTPAGLRPVIALTVFAAVVLLTLTALAPWLPGSEIVNALVEGTT